MIPFTLDEYNYYLNCVKKSNKKTLTFKDFFLTRAISENFIILRHDVDRKPENALKMAMLEKSFNINSSYYFRIKKPSFDPEIIQKIGALGHEIGYHYEVLSDARGNISKAVDLFETGIEKLRKYADIYTISMHGSPLSKHNNINFLKDENNRTFLKSKFNILGEVILDINYKDILYVSDTGRKFFSAKNNLRDKVDSNMNPFFDKNSKITEVIKNNNYKKICLQIHPERWTNNFIDYIYQYTFDTSANIIKRILSVIRK